MRQCFSRYYSVANCRQKLPYVFKLIAYFFDEVVIAVSLGAVRRKSDSLGQLCMRAVAGGGKFLYKQFHS
jgi:hypothetical protein